MFENNFNNLENEFGNENLNNEESKKGNKKIDEAKKRLEEIREYKKSYEGDKNTIEFLDLRIEEEELNLQILKFNYDKSRRNKNKLLNNLKNKKEKIEFKAWKEKREGKDL